MGVFTQSTLATTSNLITQVQTNINRGTLSTTSTPSTTQVTLWLIRAKEKLMKTYGFTWSRKFVYSTTSSGTYRYALPGDFQSGGTVIRDLTQNTRLDYTPPITFDTLYPDVAGSASESPEVYTLKNMEIWLHAPADGTYTLELEYSRSGEDSTAETWDYMPESYLFQLTDYATYRAFLMLQMWEAAKMYQAEFEFEKQDDKKSDGRKKWAQMNYQCLNWHNMK